MTSWLCIRLGGLIPVSLIIDRLSRPVRTVLVALCMLYPGFWSPTPLTLVDAQFSSCPQVCGFLLLVGPCCRSQPWWMFIYFLGIDYGVSAVDISAAERSLKRYELLINLLLSAERPAFNSIYLHRFELHFSSPDEISCGMAGNTHVLPQLNPIGYHTASGIFLLLLNVDKDVTRFS